MAVFDARGLTVLPGLVDLHAHLREPGNEEAETVASGCRAAARGGFTTVVAMPNTAPPVDRPERVRELLARARASGLARVLPAACATAERAGRAATDMEALAAAGAAAFTDDGNMIADDGLMAAAMRRAAALGKPLMDHAQDPVLAAGGVMRDGPAARRLGLPGIPDEAEIRAVERDIALSRRTACAVHVQHLSTAGAVERVRAARRQGLRVSAEATPHHLALCEDDIRAPDPNLKMNPPLCSARDRDALRQAVADGTIEVLATDHAPHRAADKARGFRDAPFGVIGLETAVPVTYTCLVKSGRVDPAAWARAWTTGPARVLGLPAPTLSPGAGADLVILDLATEWTVRPEEFASLARNTPFAGMRVTGRAVLTLLAGRPTWRDGAAGERLTGTLPHAINDPIQAR